MSETNKTMPEVFEKAECMNCGVAIYVGYVGEVVKFYQKEYRNRPADKHNLNEIDDGCWRCGYELGVEDVIEARCL